MYKTTENYKRNVYTCRQHELNIYIDEQKVNDSYIFDFDPKYDLIDDKVEFGSTPMQEIELRLHKNAIPETYKEIYVESGILNDEIVPVGYFTIKDIKDEDEYTTKIIAYDYMDKFEFKFDGSKYVPCTTGTLLQHICNEAEVELATPIFLNSNVLINTYDNTITARRFISMIAEQAGAFAHIGRDGKLYIKHIEATSYINNYINKKHINLETSINSTGNIIKINGNENGLSNTIDLYIDSDEKSVYLVDLFKQVYVNLLNGNLNISLPKELEDIVEYSLDDNGNLIAYIYDIYGNKLNFSIDICGNLIADIDPKSKIIISRKKITINLDNYVLGENDYIEYNSNTKKWYIFQNSISTEIANTTVLNSLNQLLNISLPKGILEIYLQDEISAISMDCTNFVEIPIELFKEYEFSKEIFECTRIYYEDGIRSFDYGNQTGNTIYINSDNMFIIDDGNNTSIQLQNVFNKVNGLKLRGFKGSSIIDVAIDIGDVVFIDGEPVLYQGTWEYQGRNKANISSRIQSKSREETTVTKVSTDVKIRRIQSNIDQLNGRITLLSQQANETSQKMASLQLEVGKIESKVEDVEDLTQTTTGNLSYLISNCTLKTPKAMAGEIVRMSIHPRNDIGYAFSSKKYEQNHIFNNGEYFWGDSKLYINSYNIKKNESGWINKSRIIDKNTHVFRSYGNCCCIWYKVKPSTKYTVRKFPSSRFALGSFVETDETYGVQVGDVATVYVSDENEGWGIQELEITTGENDTWLVIFYFDPNNDTDISEETVRESLNIFESGEYSNIYDLKITEPLRYITVNNEEVYDEFIYDSEIQKDNNGKILPKGRIIRRIGVDSNNNLYKLTDEIITYIEIQDIVLQDEDNIISLGYNQTALAKLKYVAKNSYTDKFATTYELRSSITQLANQVNIKVEEKVDKGDVFAEINVEIKNHRGVIELTGDEIILQGKYISIDGQGNLVSTSGEIGGWLIKKYGLFSPIIQDEVKGDHSASGIIPQHIYDASITDLTALDIAFFAGRYYGRNNSPAWYVTNSGRCYAKWFEVNGESGYFRTTYDNGKTSMAFNKDGIYRYLSNGNYWDYQGILYSNGSPYSTGVMLNDSQQFEIYDDLHDQSLAKFRRLGNNGSASSIWFYGMCYIDKNRVGSGYEIATTDMISSDKNLKSNIKECETEALPIIRKMNFKQYDWDMEKSGKEGHIDIGTIAQDLEKLNKNFVIKTTRINNNDEKIDTLSVDILNIVNTISKALQELDKQINKI